jgi:hypothetical protein
MESNRNNDKYNYMKRCFLYPNINIKYKYKVDVHFFFTQYEYMNMIHNTLKNINNKKIFQSLFNVKYFNINFM